jgi:Cu/Ag efflux protein CusF
MRGKLRVVTLAFTVALTACGVGKVPPVTRYRMHGKVLSVDTHEHMATIKHDKIVGFMDAMTMEYPVKDPKEFAALHVDETIDGTVFVQDTNFWVGEIKEAK